MIHFCSTSCRKEDDVILTENEKKEEKVERESRDMEVEIGIERFLSSIPLRRNMPMFQ